MTRTTTKAATQGDLDDFLDALRDACCTFRATAADRKLVTLAIARLDEQQRETRGRLRAGAVGGEADAIATEAGRLYDLKREFERLYSSIAHGLRTVDDILDSLGKVTQ